MASALPYVIPLAYWLVIIVLAAFFLRLACSLCRTDMPSWRRALVSVLVVTFLAYVTFDFTSYLIMRSMDGRLFQLAPWYGYSVWFREPLGLKWYIVGYAGPLRFVPLLLALAVAGILQVIVLQVQVNFGFGLLIVVLQTAATVVAGYLVALVFGVALSALGHALQPEAGTPPDQVLGVR